MNYVLLTLIILAFTIPLRVTYSSAEQGCVWNECGQEDIEAMVEAHHGSYPPSYYEKDTDEYWRAYFNYNEI